MWDWLDDAVSWVGDAWDDLDFGDWTDAYDLEDTSDYWSSETGFDGGWFDWTDAYDLEDTSDYWSSEVGFGDGGGLFSGSGGVGWGDVLGWGQDIYGAIQQGDLAEAQAASYLPLLNLYGQAQTAMAPYMDPTQTAALQSAEEERIMGMMSPYIERAAYRGRASDLSQGVGNSSIADWRDLQRQKATAELISDYAVPTAQQNVAQTAADLQNLYTSQASMLTGQPALIQSQAAAEQQTNPWSNIFLNI